METGSPGTAAARIAREMAEITDEEIRAAVQAGQEKFDLARDSLRDGTSQDVTPTGTARCSECGGYGYHEDGTDDGRECKACGGGGVVGRSAALREP